MSVFCFQSFSKCSAELCVSFCSGYTFQLRQEMLILKIVGSFHGNNNSKKKKKGSVSVVGNGEVIGANIPCFFLFFLCRHYDYTINLVPMMNSIVFCSKSPQLTHIPLFAHYAQDSSSVHFIVCTPNPHEHGHVDDRCIQCIFVK